MRPARDVHIDACVCGSSAPYQCVQPCDKLEHARATVVAFALETSDGLRRAKAKMESKGADWIVLNGPSALGTSRTSITLLGTDGTDERIADRTKKQVATRLVRLL